MAKKHARYGLTVTELIFTNITTIQRLFVNKNSYTEFHEKPADDSVADTTSNMEGRSVDISVVVVNTMTRLRVG
jgi:hypothetical protein